MLFLSPEVLGVTSSQQKVTLQNREPFQTRGSSKARFLPCTQTSWIIVFLTRLRIEKNKRPRLLASLHVAGRGGSASERVPCPPQPGPAARVSRWHFSKLALWLLTESMPVFPDREEAFLCPRFDGSI